MKNTRNEQYIQYCTETFSGNVGTNGGEVWWGIKIPATQLGDYIGHSLTKLGAFTDIDGDFDCTYSGYYTAEVYVGSTPSATTLVSTATEYLPGDRTWHDIALTTPVTINGTDDLWLCFHTLDIAYPMSGCDYIGEPNSDFLSLDGTTWEHSQDYDLYYTWMIRGLVESSIPIQVPSESSIVWSNILDKDMNLGEGAVNITVTPNSGDSPEGTVVLFTNLNHAEQQLYPIAPVTLDGSGYYAWNSFRKGDYQVQVSFDGYNTIAETVSIWDATSLNYVLTEIINEVRDLYVSRTGWAMWNGATPNPVLGGDTEFTEGFEGGLIPTGWTTIDADGDGYNWTPASVLMAGYLIPAHGGVDCISSQSYDGVALHPDNYLVSPQVSIANGSTFSFWACAQDPEYAAEHYGVAISTTTLTADAFTTIAEWTMTAKEAAQAGAYMSKNGKGTREGTWYQKTVDLSAFAGQTVWIAIRHFNCSDMYYLNVDDVELTVAAKGNRHFNNYQVELSDGEGNVLYQGTNSDGYMQLPVDNLTDGETYHLKVASSYSTGMSEWSETDWLYQSCDNFDGVTNLNLERIDDANVISWTYPGTTALGALLYRDGELLGFTTQTSYTDVIASDDHEYEICVVYDGDRQCPNRNTYYAMSCPQPIASSESYIFIGSEANHNWSKPSNWNTGALPTAEDGVVINGICELDESATIASLTVNAAKSITVLNGSTLTVMGTLATTDATQLVVEEGGQLVHNNENVQATLQKSIIGYTGEKDRYYLIANPTASTTVGNLDANEYDLFTFDPTHELEWVYQPESAITQNEGYLYANSSDVTLEFAGVLTPAGEESVSLAYYNGTGSGRDYPGFNLVGNPFACNAYIGGTFYRMNNTEIIAAIGEPIFPCEGVFVEATGIGQSLVFTTTASGREANIEMTLSQGRGIVIDRAILNFGNGGNLHKFMMNENNTQLYIPQDGEKFAAFTMENAIGEMPINFKAAQNGTYTITVHVENASYLHLIGNLTGVDTDLLAISSKGLGSYTFTALTTDYASRFKLVFSMTGIGENVADTSFAYLSNGNLVVTDAGPGNTLQIIDALGRVVMNEKLRGNSAIGIQDLKAGVYVLRLINGEKIMIQKIVKD